MGRMSAHDRREQLVEAAIAVMARDGVARATTRSIVAEAEMPLGTFHYCFRSKEELVEQVIHRINQRSYEAVLPALAEGADLATKIRNGLFAYWSHVEDDPLEHQLTYELTQYALRRSGQDRTARALYQQYLDTCGIFLTVVAEAACVDWTVPIPVIRRYLLAVIEGVTLQWLVDGDGEQARAVLDQLARHLAAMTGPR